MAKKTKTIPKLKKELQIVFNQFIRLRDKGQYCISCGEPKELQAGHYFAVGGYDGLRFNEDNVHGECAGCNCFNESHLIGYGDNLLEKIGLVRFTNLKLNAKEYRNSNSFKWSRSDLMEKISYYKAKVKEFE